MHLESLQPIEENIHQGRNDSILPCIKYLKWKNSLKIKYKFFLRYLAQDLVYRQYLSLAVYYLLVEMASVIG